MKISQLPVITEVDGTELILLVKDGANSTVLFGSVADILMNQYGLTSQAYVDSELNRLVLDPTTKIIVTTTELASALLNKSDTTHNHDTAYASKAHTHNYVDLQGLPEIPQINEAEFADALNRLTEAEVKIDQLQASLEGALTRIASLEALVEKYHPTTVE